jgi:plastocyanin
MKRTALSLVAVLAMVAALGACGSNDDKDTNASTNTTAANADAGKGKEPATIDVTASEYKFAMPAEVTGDAFKVNLKNVGKEVHIAVVTKLAAGKTMADLQGGDIGALEAVAGVASVDPGGSGDAGFQLAPGSYVMGCFVPAPDGQPHIAKGMSFPFTVKAGNGEALPKADVALQGKEYTYDKAPTLEAGTSTVSLTNMGTQDHEITVIKLDPGKTVADVGAFLAKPGGPPPFHLQGGVAVKVGTTGTTTVDLEKGGNYVFACLIPDAKDGQPHVTKGMVTKVTVT